MTKRLNSDLIYRILEKRATVRATFIEWNDERFGYQSLLDDVRKWCGLFDARGLALGTNIVILTGNERIAVSVFIAALLDGYVPIMLSSEMPSVRAKAISELTKPALMVVDQSSIANEDWISPDRVVEVSSAPRLSDTLIGRLRRAGPANTSADNLLRAFGGRRPRCSSKPDDLAYILFTSGTTSAPKGVMVTHRNLFAHLETLSRIYAYADTSAIFNCTSLAHADGLAQGLLLSLANGCRLIRPPAFSPQTLELQLNRIRAHRATHFITVPTILSLIDRYARHDDYFEADEFVALISSAAKLEEQLWFRLERRFKRPVYNMYGLTETVAGALYTGSGSDFGPLGTIGKPIDIDVQLVCADGTLTNDGDLGEIWLRGENVSPGYFANAAATTERYDGDWLKTGDLAIRRTDGAYEIRGRLNNIINSGGLLINPQELDEILASHPAVVESASIGLPDDDFGEMAVSAVKLDTNVNEIELIEYCSRFLEPKKVPKRILIVRSIPRGDAGKPQLEQLRALLAGELRQEGCTPVSKDMAGQILAIASRTFRIPVADLTLDSSPQSVARWDSFAHLNLILNVEKSLKKRIATADVLSINSLRKLMDIVSRA